MPNATKTYLQVKITGIHLNFLAITDLHEMYTSGASELITLLVLLPLQLYFNLNETYLFKALFKPLTIYV